MPLLPRRQLLTSASKILLAMIAPVAGLLPASAASRTDPRPEFAATGINEVLNFYFGTTDTADDASIEIVAPQIVSENDLVPFRVRAPGARKIAVLFDNNSSPLIMAMDQGQNNNGTIIGRARIESSGTLHCYAMRNDLIGHATLRLTIAGKWQEVGA